MGERATTKLKRMLETFASWWAQQVLFKDNADAFILCATGCSRGSKWISFLTCQRDLVLFRFRFRFCFRVAAAALALH